VLSIVSCQSSYLKCALLAPSSQRHDFITSNQYTKTVSIELSFLAVCDRQGKSILTTHDSRLNPHLGRMQYDPTSD